MSRVLVSAHRGGAGDDHAAENTLGAFRRAVEAGCDFVEFDVRFSTTGNAVVHHDLDGVTTTVTLEEVLDVIALGARAHVDLKETSPAGTREIAVVRRVIERLGVDGCVVTSNDDDSVRHLLGWAAQHAPGLRVGVSTSTRTPGTTWRSRAAAPVASCFPRARIRHTGSTLVVAHHVVARWWLRAYARRRGLPLLVWTVDAPRDLARWMNDDATWIVTTNYPARAEAARRPAG